LFIGESLPLGEGSLSVLDGVAAALEPLLGNNRSAVDIGFGIVPG
jgi:hypothetical protein